MDAYGIGRAVRYATAAVTFLTFLTFLLCRCTYGTPAFNYDLLYQPLKRLAARLCRFLSPFHYESGPLVRLRSEAEKEPLSRAYGTLQTPLFPFTPLYALSLNFSDKTAAA